MAGVAARSARSTSAVRRRTHLYANILPCASRNAKSRRRTLYSVLSRKFTSSCDVPRLYTFHITRDIWNKILFVMQMRAPLGSLLTSLNVARERRRKGRGRKKGRGEDRENDNEE